jgi:hypothetical protein
MQINTCCGYESEISYDLCPECFEHCDWENLDEEEDEEEKIKDEQDQNDMDEIMLRAAEEKLNNQ